MHILDKCKYYLVTGCICFFCINGIISQNAQAATVWVSPSGNDTTGNGSSGLPYKTINYAVSTISVNDTILLMPGTYQENVVFDNTNDFVLKSATVDTALIEAPQAGPAIHINSSIVPSSRNLVIENLLVSHADGIEGSGIFIENATVTIKNCRIFNNQTSTDGGGIQVLGNTSTQPLIINNIIELNTANRGAGIYCDGTLLEMSSNIVRNNVASQRGGGADFISCYGSMITKNSFFSNTADSGAAVFIESKTVALTTLNRLKDNLIYNNNSAKDGAGLYYEGTAVVWSFIANTFAENHALGSGGAGYFNTTFNITIQKNIVVLNTADTNGGAFAFIDIGTNTVNLWSNNITGNKAGNNGGGLYFDNVNSVLAGGSNDLSNNLFHNRDNSKLNNITATGTISNLNISQNYWGTRDSSLVFQQLSIPGLDQNLTWTNFADSPINLKIKLYKPSKYIWFADGKMTLNNGALLPAGDSLVVRTNPDTLFTINDNPASLPKIFHFNWDNVNLGINTAQLTFFLDETELIDLGNPFYENLRVLQNDTSGWVQTSTDVDITGQQISTTIADLNISEYSIGLDLNASDSVLIVTPRPNQADVNKDEPISIQFQKAMDPASLIKQNFRIEGSNSGNRDFDINIDTPNNRLYLILNDPLQAGETVTVTISDSLKTLSGEKFYGYSWQYRTSAFRGKATFQAFNQPQLIAGNNRYLFNDFNGDLKSELVELSDNSLTVFTINPDGSYNGHSQSLSSTFNRIKLADLNNDFNNEIILFNDSEVLAYSYNANGNFTQVFNRTFASSGILNDVLVFDFNNDAVPDIAFLRDLSDFREMDCYYGINDGSYRLGSLPASVQLSGPANMMSLLDWNADGLFDLIISNGSSTSNLALLTNQKNSFSSTFSDPLTEIYDQKVLATANVWEDLLYQNQSEIIMAGTTDLSDVVKLFNVDEIGTPKETYAHSFPASIRNFASGDLNSDGYNDLAVCYGKKIKLLLSNSTGMLEDTLDINTDITVTDMLIVDFDGDGDLDLFTYEKQDGNTIWQILENETRSPRSWWVKAFAKGGDGTFNNPFGKIKDAIAKTFDNDSVLVFPGRFSENLSVTHSLYISSTDSTPVILSPVSNNFFEKANVNVLGTGRFSLSNFDIMQQNMDQDSVGFQAENIDSLVLNGVNISRFNTAIKIASSKGLLANLNIDSSMNGIRIKDSEFEMTDVSVENNTTLGIIADNSTINITDSRIRQNGSTTNAANSGINIQNGSVVSLYKTEISHNGNTNIQLNNSMLSTQFVYIANALSYGQSSTGNGIDAGNGSTLNLNNTVVDNNFKFGIALDNSNTNIQNCILVHNDSLRSQNGGGLFAQRGSIVRLNNSILLANNAAFNSNSSTITADYTNFFANTNNPAVNSLGTGNIIGNPFLVFMYNPLGLQPEFDSFTSAKLAPGSPLIDQGDPDLTNGNGSSRSDIGLFGNIGLPETFESVPEPVTENADSSVLITWSNVTPAETGLWAATAIFRDTTAIFQPDTSNLLDIVPVGTNNYDDDKLVFGKQYYYRLAYVDTNGGANAYSAAVLGRIDYPDITLQNNILNVQLGQNDSLISPVGVRNSGTIPVTISVNPKLPVWLSISPLQQTALRGQNVFFQFNFNTSGLEKDSLYTADVHFFTEEDSTVMVSLKVRMLVSYRDFTAPRVSFSIAYNDTVRQSSLSFIYTASDSINSTIGTPTNLLRYMYRFAEFVDNHPVLRNSDTTFNRRVDFYPLQNGKYIFEVAAIDTAGNGGFGINSQSVTIVVKINDLIIYPKKWQMITIPRLLNSSNNIINSESVQSLRHWSDGIYEHVTIDSILPGEGYWIISKDRKNIDLTNFSVVPSENHYGVHVEEGWNMIGNPWSWNISLDSLQFTTSGGESYVLPNAISHEIINPGIYTWKAVRDSQGYKLETSGSLQLNKGYWIKVNQPGWIQYNPKPKINAFSTAPVSISLPKAKSVSDALIRLKIRSGINEDYDNYFGVCQDKSEYPHYYRDALEPPAFSDNISLYTQKDGRKLSTNLVTFSEYDTVCIWNLTFAGNIKNKPATLSWEFLNGKSGINFYLYNLETGKWFNLAEQDSFLISSQKSVVPLKLYATASENFKPEVLPVKFSLSQNYPNPFNPSTTIKFSVPYYADGVAARIDIFDILGRKVKNILNKKVKSGEIEISWKGYNESGTRVSSGVYFYRLKAGDFVAAKKMILIR